MELIQYHKLTDNTTYYHFTGDQEIHAYHTTNKTTQNKIFKQAMAIIAGEDKPPETIIEEHVKKITPGKYPMIRSRTIAHEKVCLTILVEDDLTDTQLIRLARTIFFLSKLLK